MNILKLETRGCDFSPHDEAVANSDIGNYRVCTPGFDVRGKNGRTYHMEFTKGDKWRTRKVSRSGRPLKHPVRELVAPCVAFVNASFRDADGCCWGDTNVWGEAFDRPRPYTMQGILDIVNSISADRYDALEFVRICG